MAKASLKEKWQKELHDIQCELSALELETQELEAKVQRYRETCGTMKMLNALCGESEERLTEIWQRCCKLVPQAATLMKLIETF